MAVELDSDERARVDAARLTPRPNYYSASLLRETPISEDFEAYLILQDIATISSTLTWLSTSGLLATAAIDRNALAFDALLMDQGDTSQQLEDVEEQTALFEAWRSAFQAGKFSDTPEVSLIINDLQTMADELFAYQDRLRHRQQVQQRIQSRLSQSVSSPQLRQLQSWPTPLLTY
jgi:hypothetical protein